MNDARLGDFLAKLGVVSPQQLHTAREAQAANGGRLASVLVNMGCVSEEELARLAATALRLPYVALEKVVVPKDLVALLPRQHAKKAKGILVKKEGKKYLLATCDPTNVQAFDELQFVLGGSVSPVVAAENEVIRALGHYYADRIIPDRPFDLPKSDALSYDRPEVFDIKAARAKKQQTARQVDTGPSVNAANRKAAQDRLSAAASTVVTQARAAAPQAPAPAPRPAAAMPLKDAPQAAPARPAAPAGLPPLRDAAELRKAPPPPVAEPEELEVLELEEDQTETVVTGEIGESGAYIGDDDTALELTPDQDEPALEPEAIEAASQSAADDLIAMFAAAAFGIDPATMNKPKEKNEDADALAALLGGMLGGGPSAPKADDAPAAPAEPNELAKELAHLLLDQTTEFTA